MSHIGKPRCKALIPYKILTTEGNRQCVKKAKVFETSGADGYCQRCARQAGVGA